MPLPHIWYYIHRPHLMGTNYYVNEGLPGNAIEDVEGDDQLELSTLGHIYKDMLEARMFCAESACMPVRQLVLRRLQCITGGPIP